MPEGANKIVLLSNGWIVASTTEYYGASNSVARFYVSKNGGAAWSELCRIALAYNYGASILADGTSIKALIGNSTRVRLYSFDAATITNVDIAADATKYVNVESMNGAVYECSMAKGADGRLHATWARTSDAYTSSSNIRYAVSADNGATWTVSWLTTLNTSGFNLREPVVVVRQDNHPSVAMITKATSTASNSIVSVAAYTGATWFSNISNGRGIQVYQSIDGCTELSFCITPFDVMHVAWSSDRNSRIMSARCTYINSQFTLQTPVQVSSASEPSRKPTLAVVGGKLRCYWESDINSTLARYARYNVNSQYVEPYDYYVDNGSWSYDYEAVMFKGASVASGYGFSTSSGFYTTGSMTITGVGDVFYGGGGTSIRRYNVQYSNDGLKYYGGAYIRTATKHSGGGYTNYSRGSYIDTIQATDGAYPADGKSGSYWYVKQSTGLFRVEYKTYDNGSWGAVHIMRDVDDRSPRILGDGGAVAGVIWFDSTANKILFSSVPTKVKIGEVGFGSMKIPIYDPTSGLDGKNQLRMRLPNATGCFELVLPSDPSASSLRIMTKDGIRSIAKQ
jgi:hypothetical protein